MAACTAPLRLLVLALVLTCLQIGVAALRAPFEMPGEASANTSPAQSLSPPLPYRSRDSDEHAHDDGGGGGGGREGERDLDHDRDQGNESHRLRSGPDAIDDPDDNNNNHNDEGKKRFGFRLGGFPSSSLFRRRDEGESSDQESLSGATLPPQAPLPPSSPPPPLLSSHFPLFAAPSRVIALARNSAGVLALAFLALQVARSIWSGVEAARQRYLIQRQSDAFAKAAFTEDAEEASGSSSSSSSSDTRKASPPPGRKKSNKLIDVEELQKEQEELWRVLHNIYKGHADKIVALESAQEDIKQHCSVAIKEAEASLSLGLAKLTAKLEQLERAVSAGNGGEGGSGGNKEDAKIMVDSLRQDVRREMNNQSEAMAALRKEMPALLRQHDEVVVAKLQEFGEDVKRLILQSSFKSQSKSKSLRNDERGPLPPP